jgi:hypothetical protein
MKKVPAAAWDVLVLGGLMVWVYAYRFHIFDKTVHAYNSYCQESDPIMRVECIRWMLEGPIYLLLFIGYALHATTLYARLNSRSTTVLVVSTTLPVLGIAASLMCTPLMFLSHATLEFLCHAGPLVILSVITLVCRKGVPAILASVLMRLARAGSAPRQEPTAGSDPTAQNMP